MSGDTAPDPSPVAPGLPTVSIVRPLLERRRAVEPTPRGSRLAVLTLTALGVVYGDIGTSPLYAFRQCFNPAYGIAPTPAAVYGVLSLIVWALILVVSVKYLVVMLRADNRGEGGILALLALVRRMPRPGALLGLGLFGAALLYGDGVITPAISVLSAAEGLEVVAPAFGSFVVPSTLLILLLVFAVQKMGTARVGGVFGPIMLVWFLTLGGLGAAGISRHPGVLRALGPWHGARFFVDHGVAGFLVLGAVVLAVTGAEALYADLGHFGRRPIRLAWFGLVLPVLLLNYFGQGALILDVPEAVRNPFYQLAPRVLLIPLLVVATLATIVASQALVSGAFSLTQQAVRLGYVPRVTVVHTSRAEPGQIYVPEVNAALMVGCLLLVVGFRSSSALAAAYGIAVTGTMAITTALFYMVARHRWRWRPLAAFALASVFLVIDLAFFVANIVKVSDGGWVPLAIGGAVYLLMMTWKRGTDLFNRILWADALPLDRFLAEVEATKPPRVPGTAVFLTAHSRDTPRFLLLHLRQNKVLHAQVILLSILTEETPEVSETARVIVERLAEGLFRVKATYGFMEAPDAPEVIARCADLGIRTDPEDTTYYLGRARILPVGPARMAKWRKLLYAFMSRNARSATEYFGIPSGRVVELGGRIEL